MSSLTNRPPVSFRSASTDCWNTTPTDILDSSDAILNDLNSIIDSHKKYMKFQNSENSQNNSTVTKVSLPKKSASHLVNKSAVSSILDTSNSENRNSTIHIDQATAREKFKSKSYLLSMGRQTTNSLYLNQSFDSKSSQKSFLAKKSSNSNLSCSQPHATISGSITSKASKSKSSTQNAQLTSNMSGSATTTSFINTTAQKKKRSSLFNLFSFNKSVTSSTSNLPLTDTEPDYQNSNFLESREAFSTAGFNQPLPEFISNWSCSNSTTTENETPKCSRPHSVAFYSNASSASKSPVPTLTSNSSLKASSKQSLDIDDSSSGRALTASTAASMRKTNSVRTKGFSVPLNASFCVNPVPNVNCIQSLTNPTNSIKFSGDNNRDCKNRAYRTKGSSFRSTQLANASMVSFDEADNYVLKNASTSDNSEQIDFDEIDDSGLFKPGDSFNINDDGSCLKELNQRLKMADENNENREKANRNRLTKQKKFDEACFFSNQITGNLYESTTSGLQIEERANSCSSSVTSTSSGSDTSSSRSNSDTKYLNLKPRQQQNNELARSSSTKIQPTQNIISSQIEIELMPYSSKEFPFKYTVTPNNSQLETSEHECNNGTNITRQLFLNRQSIGRRNSLPQKRLEHTSTSYDVNEATEENNSQICLALDSYSDIIDDNKNTNRNQEIMVQSKKGMKLRDLLRPILHNQNIDIEKCSIYDQASLTASTSLVDLNDLCDTYSGSKLFVQRTRVNKDRSSSTKEEVPVEETGQAKMRHKSFHGLKSESYVASMNIDENSLLNTDNASHNQSSNNWQNYFNNKMSFSAAREKPNTKQKRNSCMAAMNELNSTSQINASFPTTPNLNNITASPVAATRAAYLEKPAHSLPSTGSMYPTNQTSASNTSNNNSQQQQHTSPGDTQRTQRTSSKNLRKMSQLTNIFSNYNSASKSKDQLKLTMDKILENFLVEPPKLSDDLCLNYYDPSLFEIEPDWNKFVGETFAQSLHKTQAKQQMAIWELLTTEASHIKTTKIIVDVFLSCLVGLKCHEATAELFKEIEINKLFSNIIEVFNCNVNFWQTYMYPIVQSLRESNSKIIDPLSLVEGFSNFKSLFISYEEFILEKANSLENFKKHTEENEFFSKFIMWAENNPLVGRLKIADFMMIPVQRLTKYELLLKKIHQFTEDEAKREQISYIIDCVYALPNHINIKLKYLAQFNNISESIEKYEGIVGPTDEINDLLGSYKHLDIKAPLPGCLKTSNRELIHQGPLKLKDTPKSFDVHCFLFTDLLLITQLKKTKKYKIIRPPVNTSRIIIKELSQTDKAFVVISMNDYKVPESVCMFISNQSKKWVEFLEIARTKYCDEMDKARDFYSNQGFKAPASPYRPQISIQKDNSIRDSKAYELSSNKSTETVADEVAATSALLEGQASSSNSVECTNLTASSEDVARRDSAATLTMADAAEASTKDSMASRVESREETDCGAKNNSQDNGINNSHSFKSLKSGSQSRQYQQQHSVRFNSRILDRRIQRRNMTDPLSSGTQINGIDEKHSVIMNSIIKRNSLNDKPKSAPKPTGKQLTATLCGDSTSTILSTDSGVSEPISCENNHISYSDESISKSPTNANFIETTREVFASATDSQVSPNSEDGSQELVGKRSSTLKPTNSVLSTASSTFSSSSSSHEPNMSYSSSFNSTSSSSRLPSKSNSLNSKRNQHENTLNEMENESNAGSNINGRNCIDDYVNNNENNLLSGDDDYDGYYDIDEPNLSHIPNDATNEPHSPPFYNESYPSQRLYSAVKIKNKSFSDMPPNRARLNTVPQLQTTSKQLISTPNNKYDLNNNATEAVLSEERSSQYYDIINRSLADPTDKMSNKMNGKFQQPYFSLNSGMGGMIVNRKKPLVRVNTPNMTNDLIRANSNEIVLNNINKNSNLNTPITTENQFDSALQLRANNTNAVDSASQRMTLVKLLHTTMDATEV